MSANCIDRMFLDRERLYDRRLFCYIKADRDLNGVWSDGMENKLRKGAYLSVFLLLLIMSRHVPFAKNTRFLSLGNLKCNTRRFRCDTLLL